MRSRVDYDRILIVCFSNGVDQAALFLFYLFLAISQKGGVSVDRRHFLDMDPRGGSSTSF